VWEEFFNYYFLVDFWNNLFLHNFFSQFFSDYTKR
jgi:hypothetical protein